ncbi:hypothetical protein JJQ59_36750 (plasmid) [Cupriavidus necator]|uniref:Uncharacterized protein n=1 Tax=Cupriavidus necator TaxID=106590 RepID=A0A367PEG9_CUPNE|nr:type IV toxin-antitoxin system AbiEi family antitoxin [Cupriavidus necator]QQX89120.1 hypothetical protein JJQ59_36750 [Cupriavidus necator]RCJ05617.1 hypothetical protein DDK22_25485 [Cupriavidus necator]
MQNPYHSELERLLLEDAALAFEQTTGMRAVSEGPVSSGPRSLLDGLMHFDLGHGRTFTMPVEVKSRIDRFATVARLKEAQEKLGEQLLLVTDYLSPEMAEALRDNQLSFLDTAGNVSLNRPEALLYIAGRRNRERKETALPRRTGSPKQLEVLYALITNPTLVSAPYRAIASVAQVAISTVNVAIDDFLERQLLIVGANGKRQFGDWDRIVEEWVSLYPIKLRPKLACRRYSADRSDWWQSSDISKHGAVFSAEVAAAKLTHHLRPQRVMLYAASTSPKQLILEARLRADPQGEIEIVQAFWPMLSPQPMGVPADVAHPILVYADLLDSRESRNVDLARKIKEDYLGHRPYTPT